jgi:hypothetical protein
MLDKFGRLATIALALLLLLTACNRSEQTLQVSDTATPTGTLAPVASPTPEEPQPAPFESPLPAPTATLSAFDSPLPPPARGPSSENKAAIKGELVLLSPEFTAPQEDGLYLVMVNTEEQMVLPSVDETSIQAEVDEVTGQFFFDDVGVGLYAVVVLTDRGQQMSAREMDTGAASIVTVGEEDLNSVIDLGTLRLP